MKSASPSATAAPPDEELLAAHRAGDPHAFAMLAHRHQAALWAVALRTLRHPEDAADAVQEALVAAYRRADGYRGDASVRTWLHRIVVNACIDRIRHDRARPTVPLPGQEPPAGDGWARDRRRADLAAEVAIRLDLATALAELPVDQRVAVVLVDVEGWPVHEVARMLEVPAGTVKSRCARGRAKLAVLLGHLREEQR